jgi:hypothetical protein
MFRPRSANRICRPCFIKDGIGYMYYAGGRRICLPIIAVEQLTNWQSEGERSIDQVERHK